MSHLASPGGPASGGMGDGQVAALADELLSRRMQPEDPYEIAAILESMGWTDSRVYEAFGFEDVFALAHEIWDTIQYKIIIMPMAAVEKTDPKLLFWELSKAFLRGLIFALPMAISVFSMLTLKFSLWSYENFTVEMATCIAIGTILSFIVVGGFTQAIARRGFFYLYQGYYTMGRKITFFFIRAGFAACGAAALFLYGFNLLFRIYPGEMFGIIVVYFFFLNAIWLSVTVMYILRKELTFTGLIIMGILIVYLLFRVIKWDILFAQLVAVSVVSVSGMFLVYYFFRAAEAREEKGIAPKMTRLSITVYSIQSYFLYGFLYFTFLYVDRIMAWSADRSWAVEGDYMPYFIWFRGDYELGLDFALLVLMIPLGIAEVMVQKFMLDLEKGQKRFLLSQTDSMNRHFLRKYHRMLFVMLVVSAASAVLVYAALLYLQELYAAHFGKPLVADDVTYHVFGVALAAYVILAVALMNAVMMFSLSQPDMSNRPLLTALGVNLLLGFVLSRWVGNHYAVYGLWAGSTVFAVLTYKNMRKLLKNLDYFLYAAS